MLIACRLCIKDYADVLNAIIGLYFIVYLVTLVCCKIVFSLAHTELLLLPKAEDHDRQDVWHQ